jgi:hypothetical protein
VAYVEKTSTGYREIPVPWSPSGQTEVA